MRIFGGERLQKWMERLNVPEDEPIGAPIVSRSIENAQKRVEGHNFDIRKHLLDYDDVMNKQRKTIYQLRREILEGNSLDEIIIEYLGDVTSHHLDTFAPEGVPFDQWDLDGLKAALQQQFAIVVEFDTSDGAISSERLTDLCKEAIKTAFEKQKQRLGPYYDQIKKMVLLQTIDTKWKDHLQTVDHLRENVSLRGYAQKDPLIEYKKEAFAAFELMDTAIKTETIEKLFKIQIVAERAGELEEDLGFGSGTNDYEMSGGDELESFEPSIYKNRQQEQMAMNAGPAGQTAGGPPQKPEEPYVRSGEKVGRNDPCPCGSGKKYKKCHGANN